MGFRQVTVKITRQDMGYTMYMQARLVFDFLGRGANKSSPRGLQMPGGVTEKGRG